MIYFLYGKDSEKKNKKKNTIIGDHGFFSVSQSSFNNLFLEEKARSVPMFGKLPYFVFDSFLEEEENNYIFIKNVELLSKSPNIFIFLEEKVKKDTLKKIEKVGGNIFLFEAKEKKKETPFTFLISDAFSSRDKKLTWLLLLEAYEKDIAPEEIAGTLFWAIKNMIIAKKTNNPTESGIHPYVFQKSKNFSKNFTEDELLELLQKISNLYHSAHGGVIDFSLGLEKFVLEQKIIS